MARNRLGNYDANRFREAAAAAFNSPTVSNYGNFAQRQSESFDEYSRRIGKSFLEGLGENVADEGYYRSVGTMLAKLPGAERVRKLAAGENPDTVSSPSTIADALGSIGQTAFTTGNVYGGGKFSDILGQLEANTAAAAVAGDKDMKGALELQDTRSTLQDMIASQYSGGARNALYEGIREAGDAWKQGYVSDTGPSTFYNLLREKSIFGNNAASKYAPNPVTPPPVGGGDGGTGSGGGSGTGSGGGSSNPNPTVNTGPTVSGRDPNAPSWVPDGYTLPVGYTPPASDPEAMDGFKFAPVEQDYGIYASFVRNFGRPPMQYEINYYTQKAQNGEDIEHSLANNPAARRYRETGQAVPTLKSFDDADGLWRLMEFLGIPEDQFDATRQNYAKTFGQHAFQGRA